ncbi:unnamed protein product [Musa acuminata var. zebrina]
MQDFGAIPGGGGGGGGGRVRDYPPLPPAQPQLPVKCPRCDSTNTKFCYYNNYNLAQPRHFCKSCRRYWTKGGVLRNVPVGGGCRKSKRSSMSKPSGGSERKDPPRRLSAAPRSSSGSGSGSGSGCSTLATADVPTSTTPFPNSALLTPPPDPNPDPAPSFDSATTMEVPLVQAADIFPDTSTAAAGSFPSQMSLASTPAILGFNRFPDSPPVPLPPQSKAAEEISAQTGFTNQAVAIDPRGAGSGAGCAIAGMDWPGASVDPAFFDLATAVDPASAYWSHGHWEDADPALYLP